jgi:hypothetical protein
MKFNGVIQKVLPKRSGVSERTGNEWATQGFIFEYKENKTDRLPDRVILETFDTNVMAEFEKLMVLGADGKPIVDNATISLSHPLYASIGFYHKTKVYTNKQGQQGIMNDISIYDFEWLKQPQTPPENAQAANIQQPTNSPQSQNNAPTGGANGDGGDDDLPF